MVVFNLVSLVLVSSNSSVTFCNLTSHSSSLLGIQPPMSIINYILHNLTELHQPGYYPRLMISNQNSLNSIFYYPWNLLKGISYYSRYLSGNEKTICVQELEDTRINECPLFLTTLRKTTIVSRTNALLTVISKIYNKGN